MLTKCLYCRKISKKRGTVYKFCSSVCANRFNLNGLKKVKLPRKSVLLAEFVGICLGDGCISRYQVSVTLNTIADKEYIPYVINLMQNLFPTLKVSLRKKGGENAVDVQINSRIVTDFFHNMGIIPRRKIIPLWILKRPIYIKACLRGLFDTEGSISYKFFKSRSGEVKLYKQLNFRNADPNFIIFVRDSLLSLGFRPTKTLTKSIYISNKKDIELFSRVIGFGNPKLQTRSLVNDFFTYSKLI